tara:strand:+ start:1364 stop:1510 length:147 start_codon:yes stop_codon:yes gene_type:complete
MKNDNQWMMMTYYCPTHGSGEKCEQIQLTSEELTKTKKDYKFSTKYRN